MVATPRQLQELAQLPEVAELATATVFGTADPGIAPLVLDDPRLGHSVSRFKLLAGRLPDLDRPDEAMVSFLAAQAYHRRVGGAVTLHGVGSGAPGAPVTLRVVGIEATAGEFPAQTVYSTTKPVYLSAAFLRTPAGVATTTGGDQRFVFVAVRLREGARAGSRFTGDALRVLGGATPTAAVADQTATVQRSMHQQALALWLMAAFAALATTVIFSQLLVRHVAEEQTDASTAHALGMTRGELAVSALLQIAAVAVTAAAGAVLVTTLASPVLPLGTARIAEPHPGLAFDATALGLGAATIVVVVGLLGVAAVLTRRRPSPAPLTRPSTSPCPAGPASMVGRLPLPLVGTTGVRLAMQPGRGRTAVRHTDRCRRRSRGGRGGADLRGQPALHHLLGTPRLYGVTFDADVEPQSSTGDAAALLPAVRADPTVAAVAVGSTAIPMSSGQVSFGVQETAAAQGSLEPTVLDGRLPAAADEILLGQETARALHTQIGRTIPVLAPGFTRALRLRVVGLDSACWRRSATMSSWVAAR